jgi:hypothetical protein
MITLGYILVLNGILLLNHRRFQEFKEETRLHTAGQPHYGNEVARGEEGEQ